MVTFASGSNGNITIGDANTDNLVINADVNSHIIPNIDDTYDLGFFFSTVEKSFC